VYLRNLKIAILQKSSPKILFFFKETCPDPFETVSMVGNRGGFIKRVETTISGHNK
jgi:hypothetical protein